jgi:hypothetical protein
LLLKGTASINTSFLLLSLMTVQTSNDSDAYSSQHEEAYHASRHALQHITPGKVTQDLHLGVFQFEGTVGTFTGPNLTDGSFDCLLTPSYEGLLHLKTVSLLRLIVSTHCFQIRVCAN